MKITCQSCQSKYNVADEKVQGKIVKIRCRKCGATIVVQGTGGAATNGAAATGGAQTSAVAEADAQWHVNVAEGEPRTMPLSELVEACNSGAISLDTYIWTDGMDDWKPVTEVEAVMTALSGGAGTATSGDLQASAEPAFQSSAADESRGAAYEPALPLDAAAFQAPADRPSEPRRAAVAKREARGRDLFGTVGTGGGEEVQTSAPAVPRMLAGPADVGENKATGERNENSVLFSLAVLTKDADERSPQEEAPKSSGRNTEDSGLIDLKALALKAESRRPPAFSDVGAFAAPLGFTAPSAGVLGSPSGEPPPKSKLPLLIGGGAGVALLLVLGIVIGVKLGGGGAAAAASAAPLSIPTATVEPTATVAATATAEPSATAAPTASVAAKPKTYGGGGGGGTYHPPAGGGAKPAGGTPAAGAGGGAAPTPPPTPPPPKKAGSDCGCNGDLMCLMKCSTH